MISEAKFHMGCILVLLEACSSSKRVVLSRLKWNGAAGHGRKTGPIFLIIFLKNYLSKSKTELVDLESIYIQGQILKHSPLYIGRRFWTGGM